MPLDSFASIASHSSWSGLVSSSFIEQFSNVVFASQYLDGVYRYSDTAESIVDGIQLRVGGIYARFKRLLDVSEVVMLVFLDLDTSTNS